MAATPRQHSSHKKGFQGEKLTIASASALAYQGIGDIKGIEELPGLKRDGKVPEGDISFMPFESWGFVLECPPERLVTSEIGRKGAENQKTSA